MRRLVEFGAPAAFYIFALAAQMSGIVNPAIALALAIFATLLLFFPACHHSYAWHKARKGNGAMGLDSWYFIAPCLVVAILAIAGAAYGLGLRAAAVPSVSSEHFKAEAAAKQSPSPSRSHYSEPKKKELSEVLYRLEKVLRVQGGTLIEKYQNVGLGNPFVLPESQGTQAVLGDLIRSIDELHKAIWTDLIPDKVFGPEVQEIMRNDHALTRAKQEASNIMRQYGIFSQFSGPDNLYTTTRVKEAYVGPTSDSIRSAMADIKTWLDESNARLVERQRSLSE